MALVLTERRGAVARSYSQQSREYNALTWGWRAADLDSTLRAAEADAGVRAILLTGWAGVLRRRAARRRHVSRRRKCGDGMRDTI